MVLKFRSTIFPFNSVSSNKIFLACCTSTDSDITQQKDLEIVHDSSLSLKLSSDLELLINQCNNATPENSNCTKIISSFKYYNNEETHNIEIAHTTKSLSLFHINACSLNKYIDNIQYLYCTNCKKYRIYSLLL